MLYAYSKCSMRIQNTLGATSSSILCSYWLTQRRDGSYWLIPSLAHFLVALATSRRRQDVALCVFKMWRELLCGYSKCCGSCSIVIQNAGSAAVWVYLKPVLVLQFSTRRHDKIEQLSPHFEYPQSSSRHILNAHWAASQRIQNKNDNFEWFWSLSIRTSRANIKLKGQLKKF